MKTLLKLLVGLTLLVAVWHLSTVIFQIPAYLVPSPVVTYLAFVENFSSIFPNSIVTISEVLLGFLIANVLSVFLALSISFFPKIEGTAVTAAIVLKTLPIIAIAPLLVLWFGPGIWSKVAAVVVICFFPAFVNILRGTRSLDSASHDLIRLYSPTRLQIVRYFILPGIKPYLYSALKVSSSLAVVGALVGEFISANSGLGFLIISSYYTMNIPLVFATLFVTSALGLVLYGSIHLVEKREVSGRLFDYN